MLLPVMSAVKVTGFPFCFLSDRSTVKNEMDVQRSWSILDKHPLHENTDGGQGQGGHCCGESGSELRVKAGEHLKHRVPALMA